MSRLTKATLSAVDGQGAVSDTVDVQFNPTSLRLSMANSIDTGNSRGRQDWRYNGTSSSTLTVDLVFDTADEGTTDAPVDVRDHTAAVRRFLLPPDGSTDAPPRVQFHWGTFLVTGVMSSATENLALWSADGTPLRAEVSITVKEQDPRFAAPRSTTPARAPLTSPALPAPFGPGGAGLAPGLSDRMAEALGGESAADFLTRQGLDPDAWRAVANGVDDALDLQPGEPIGFSLDLPIGGIGLGGGALSFGGAAGFTAGGGGFGAGTSGSSGTVGARAVDVTAQLGLASGDAAAGFALAAAGGLTAAVQTASATAGASLADAGRTAFEAPTAGAAGTRTAPVADGDRTSVAASTGAGTTSAGGNGAGSNGPTTTRPVADPRATGYGRGVPLRERATPTEATRTDRTWVTVGNRAPVAAVAAQSGASCRCGGRGRGGCSHAGGCGR